MKGLISKSALTCTIIILLATFSSAQSIDGTYVLETRIMADGTELKPPAVIGVYNLKDGYVNLNIASKDSSGKVAAISLIGKYKFSPKEYFQEVLFVSRNDEKEGTGAKYYFVPKSGTSPVTITGNKIEFVYPPEHNIHATFEGDTFTAKRVDGTYTDIWKKVE